MAGFNITPVDRDYIVRAVATEADHRLAQSNPEAYQSQVAGIIDTIINRAASGQYPNTIQGVLDEKNQFSAINGPTGRGYTVWGSVANVPDRVIPEGLSGTVNEWINARIEGTPSSVGGHLSYANPLYSDAKNLEWINELDGPRYGDGNSIHYHGTPAGAKPFEATITGDLYNGAGVKLPPGYIPEVATLLDISQPLSPAKQMAARVNDMLDAMPPIPAPRAKGTVARINAEFDRPRPATQSPELAAARNPAAGVQMPRPRPTDQPNPTDGATPISSDGIQFTAAGKPIDPDNGFLMAEDDPRYPRGPAPAAQPAPVPAPASQRPQETPASPGRVLPVVGPTGIAPRADPVGNMPTMDQVAGLGRRSPAAVPAQTPQRPAQVPSGGMVERAPPQTTQPPAPGITRTPATAGNVAMPPGARPSVATDLVTQADTGARQRQPVPSGGLAGQDRAVAASPADIPKYVTTTERVPLTAQPARKEVPIGDTLHHGSRDSVTQAAAGAETAAKKREYTTRTVTALNPAWVEAQKPAKPAPQPAPANQRPTAPQDAPGLGEQILGGARTALGIPAEGIGPGIVRGVQGALGIGRPATAQQPATPSQPRAPNAAERYNAANANAAARARENASSPEHRSSNSWFNEVTGR